MSYDSTMPMSHLIKLENIQPWDFASAGWYGWFMGKSSSSQTVNPLMEKNICPKWSIPKNGKNICTNPAWNQFCSFLFHKYRNKPFIQKPRAKRWVFDTKQQGLPTSTGCRDQLNDLRHWLPYQDAQWHASTLLASWKFPGSFFLKPRHSENNGYHSTELTWEFWYAEFIHVHQLQDATDSADGSILKFKTI